MSWMNMTSETTLTGDARRILNEGGRPKDCDCPGRASCKHTAYFLIGTMIAKGCTISQVRSAMLDYRNKGAEFITCQVDPIAAFIDAWNYCAKPSEVHEEPPTEDEQRATLLFLIETRPGISSSELRKFSGMRHDTTSKHLKWLTENNLVKRDESGRGRRVAHYRTGAPYTPLDGVRLREYQNLWLWRVTPWDASVVRFVLSQEVLQTFWQRKLAEYLSTPGHAPVTIEQFFDICELNNESIEELKEKSYGSRPILSVEDEEPSSLSTQQTLA